MKVFNVPQRVMTILVKILCEGNISGYKTLEISKVPVEDFIHSFGTRVKEGEKIQRHLNTTYLKTCIHD